ncbi:EAL domain protein [Acidithrix ferrooxidans]|uniref:EAL domain protein n=2 Tax=Acidithrix ferrooxidans TaxID=1280514 RepID=A0A0D8HCJ1_9ACTN|nr:EAL domain protein [Acidithrix ferrooxidans]
MDSFAHAHMDQTAVSNESILARQPIFDRLLEVVGYELLFRGRLKGSPMASQDKGDLMTAQLMVDAFVLGIERITGEALLFLNADHRIIAGEVPIVFPPDRTVLEIPRTILQDDELAIALRRLSNEGFLLALDDFEWFDGVEKLLEVVDFIKVDIQRWSDDEITELIRVAKIFHINTIALKVETWEELERFTEMGFSFFQGYVLSRPQLIEGRTLAPANLTNIRLAAELNKPASTLDEVACIVQRDPALAYRVLQGASEGSFYGMKRSIRSLNEAIALLGWRRLQTWVTLMLLVEPANIPDQRIATALIRARLCEQLAIFVDPELANAAYTTGLLSSLDLLLGVPVQEVLAGLPIDPEVASAALFLEGDLGKILAEAEFLQLGFLGSGELEDDFASQHNIPISKLQLVYLDAVEWGDQMTRALVSSILA